VRDVGEGLQAESGKAHLDRREAENLLGMRDGEPEDRSPADVLAGEVNRPDIELLDEDMKVLGGDLASPERGPTPSFGAPAPKRLLRSLESTY
jgi:hypothetical protein